jgi:group II intron reverse transcriptase/maturase
MMAKWRNKRRWHIAALSALAPGMGQWYNKQVYKALVFLIIHSCAIIWLWTPLLSSWHLSKNQCMLAIAGLAVWILSVLDAYVYTSNSSVPFFRTFTSMRMLYGIALIAILSALTALSLEFPDPILRGSRISLLFPGIPIASAVVFDPFTGGFAGLMATLFQVCFHPDSLSAIVILRCLSILTACGLGAIIGKRKYQLAGISALVPDAVDVFTSGGQYSILSFPVFERLIVHWAIVTGVVILFLLIKKWYLVHSVSTSSFFERDQHSQITDAQAKQNTSLSDFTPQTRSEPLAHQSRSVSASACTLWDKLLDTTNLKRAWERVLANNSAPGVDGVKVEDFALNAEENISSLRSLLENGRYEPLPLKQFTIPKPSGSLRQLSIPAVRDRIVQQALMQVLVPIFEPQFLECSFAYRPGRSAHNALKQVERHLSDGNRWILDGDIKSFFDTVDHNTLIRLIAAKIGNSAVLDLIRTFLSIATQSGGTGIPQGSATSTLYANIYLHIFDKVMVEAGYNLTRYADDFVVLSATSDKSRTALDTAYNVLQDPLRLQLNQEKTRICSLSDGFVFLGYHFDESGHRASERAVETLTARIQERLAESEQRGETGTDAARKLRSSLLGWCNYFGMEMNQLLNDSGQFCEIRTPRGSSEYTEEHLSRFLILFSGRADVYARQWVNNSGKNGYVPIRQELSSASVRSHLMGEITIAVYLIRQDNTVSFMAIDIDSKAELAGDIEDAHEMALRIKELGARHGLPVYLEESGSKGRHCWIFFSGPIPAGEAHQLGKLLVVKAGAVNKGISCEVFPKQERVSPDALGSLIKLPLGVHQVSRKRCLFLEDDGSPVSDQGRFLLNIKQISHEIVRGAMARLSGNPSVFPAGDMLSSPDFQRMLNGCRVLKYLVDKAKEVKHLNHTERLILLYTFGHLGEEGSAFVHRVMNYCENYSHAITQKWLNRMEPGRTPISCARIKDWLYDVIPVIGCACSGNIYNGMYPSPMFYAPEARQDTNSADYVNLPDMRVNDKNDSLQEGDQADKSGALSCVDDVWREMETDIFSEE